MSWSWVMSAREMLEETPLYTATANGDLESVELLVKKEPLQVNVPDELGSTPLHAAAFDCRLDICDCLIRHGANVNTRDVNGNTPLHEAAFSVCPDVVTILVNSGATVDAVNNAGRTPLHRCSRRGSHQDVVAKELVRLSAKLDLNSAIRLGWYKAAQESIAKRGLQEAIFLDELIVDVVSNRARRQDAREMVTTLLHHGANVNGTSYGNETALLVACEDITMPLDVVETLLDNGADPYIRRLTDGRNGFEIAHHMGKVATITLLRKYGVLG